MPDGMLIEYVHDPLGRRIAKKIDGKITEKYLWQVMTRLLAVYDGNDNLLMRFEYADARMPIAMTSGGIKYHLAYDQVGSLRAVIDGSGSIVKSLEYDSFGNIITDSNPNFSVPFGFAGGLHDRDTGLVRFGYRDYDPDIGRWTAKDPILFKGGDTDLFGYCLNDPVNSVDVNGLISKGDIINWFGSVGSTIAKEGGLISAKLASRLSIIASILGELIDPPSLNANEKQELEQYWAMQEIEELEKLIEELEERMAPMLEKFHIPSDLDKDEPCQ